MYKHVAIILFLIIVYFMGSSEADVVKIKVEFDFNCRKVIPDDPNSEIGTIKATKSYSKDISCANLNFTFVDQLDFEINETTTQTRLSITKGSIIPYNGNNLYVSYGTIISGACFGASWGRLVPEPTDGAESCIAGCRPLGEVLSLKSCFAIINGGCGFNLCEGTVNTFIDPPLNA